MPPTPSEAYAAWGLSRQKAISRAAKALQAISLASKMGKFSCLLAWSLLERLGQVISGIKTGYFQDFLDPAAPVEMRGACDVYDEMHRFADQGLERLRRIRMHADQHGKP